MFGRWYAGDTLLQGLAQDFEHIAAELGQLIEEEHAVVHQRHLAGHRHVAPADQADIRDGMVGCATWAGRDQRRAVASEAGDTVDARGLDGLGEGHRRQDGGEPPCQHRLARPRRAEQQEVMGRTPASPFGFTRHSGVPMATLLTSLREQVSRDGHIMITPSSNAFASCRSAVSKPSVNQP